MNDELARLLEELERLEEKTSEHSISSKINKATEKDQSPEAIAERLAFGFCEDYLDKQNSWGTYYGPMMVWVGDDGKAYESPSLSLVDDDIIEYWKNRSQNTKNPIMKARYSGLVWDLSEAAIGKKPNYRIAIDYVNALLDVTDKDLCEHPTETITKITRAYKVASALNNSELIGKSIESAIKLEDRIAEDDKAGLWGFCFDLFVLSKCRYLSDVQKKKLIEDLESRLERVSKEYSPWVCESAGIPLATYYRSKGMDADVSRVIDVVGSCFEDACEGLAAMQASSWLQHVHDIYISFNMKDAAEIVSRKISEVGPEVVESMQEFSHSMEIPREKLDAYLDSMTSGGLETTLNRIAIQFIPKKDQVEQQVLELAKNHPLTYLFTKTLQDHKGRPVATIGGVEEDLEGNVIHQLSQNMNIDSFFLRHSFNKASEVYGRSSDELTSFILRSPIFEESKKDIVQKGVKSYLDEDYMSAIHILVPQAEAAIRTLVELMGGATLRKNRQGGLQLRTFDDLLRDESVENCFGADTSFYFRMLLTDQRGWNIRNDVCHGISPAGAFHYSTADRIMHVMLCLSQVRESNA
ncbi:DUF4209 domain-containing protein [Brumicola blandensis]|uniref:DUF4209 domain-containing protein n=1 Tax=Brumicola blandensis TaxID=3075611 RepID=A0AAW8QXU2_9ALTE|nr:DUF4209 domain-containing protein [Alteromonas sp. W409]MDT0581821.1 DUF4209 domain-containing protein [Alteromonas sp. W409]